MRDVIITYSKVLFMLALLLSCFLILDSFAEILPSEDLGGFFKHMQQHNYTLHFS